MNHLRGKSCSNLALSVLLRRKIIVSHYSIRSPKNSNEIMSNLLKNELSPYLLQHQHNPVHWHPWNPTTLEKAKRENKPIFLSSGYSTCHWCHVMERESFENPRIAEIMNTHFINIKLDREERPDLDRVYMTFVQAVTGSGGWPMSVWMTPDLLPYYGGTYFPPEDRYFGRPGFKALLQTLADHWEENPEKCLESSVKIIDVMKKNAKLAVSSSFPSDAGKKCLNQLTRSFEPAFGGFSEQPKFPQPVNLQFLIHYSTTEPDCFKMVEQQLKMMRQGGIYDHLGLGFSRYSTDKKWHVPHFEKMLYDQAQLTMVYLKAFLLTKDQFYADVAQEILSYVTRDMSTEDGGFFSAEDADSLPTKDSTRKKEGAFYVWEKAEIDEVLANIKLSDDQPLSALFCERFGVKENGNVDPYQDPHDELKNKNVLFEAKTLDCLVKEFSITLSEVESSLNTASQKLLEWRNANRPRPHLDNKFIASWNGLMLSAFAQAGFILSNPIYIQRAKESAEFIENHLIIDGDLLRTCYFKDSNIVNLDTPIKGCVDDFSNVISGMLDTFQCTGEPKYLEIALKLQAKQDELFWDEKDGGYFNSRANDTSVIVLMKDDDDGAEPSSNSTSLINLLRLSSIDSKFSPKVSKLLYQFSDRIGKIPITLPLMTSALLSHLQGVPRITVVGKDLEQKELYKKLRMKLLPVGTLVILVDTEKDLTELKTIIPELANKNSDGMYVKIGESDEKKETDLARVF